MRSQCLRQVQAMAKYELQDAVKLFLAQTSNITALWTVYAVGTFAVAGFGASDHRPSIGVVVALTIGFWLFVASHLALIIQALSITRELEREIKSVLAKDPEAAGPFRASLGRLAHTANPIGRTVALHLLVDVCVTLALLAPHIFP
jgi:hypothetical protein